MKKTIIALSVALCGMFSTAFAQTAAGTPGQKVSAPAQVCTQTQCPATRAFEGITLTPEQQKKIDALQTECRYARQATAKEARDAAKAMADARKDARKEYLKKIKGILTPEQYVQFLENAFLQQGHRPDGKQDRPGKAGKYGKAHKAGKHGKAAMRGQRAMQSAEAVPTVK